MLSSEFVSALCCGLLLSGCGGGEPQSETSPKGDKTQEQPEPAAPSTADTVCSADAPLVTIPPEDPEVQYSGRFDFSDPTRPVGSASGVSVSLRFRGDSVRVSFEDQFLWNSDTNVNQGYYDVIVDDLEPVKLEPVKGVTDYDVPVELPCEEHTVTLFKRTEANIGNFTFLGFQVAQALDAPAPPEHRILVIGDSITCGSGVDAQDGTPECASDGATGYWGQPYENAYGAWGSVLARAVGAERQTVCESGKGLVRNYSDQYDARPIPEVYDLTFIESNQADTTPMWDPSRYVPGAILIALGTNDFSPGEGGPDNPREALPVQDFVDAFVAFIDRLKGDYPGVHVFLVSSPLLGDGWPTAEDHFRTDQLDAHDQVVAHYEGAADVTVQAITVSKIYPPHGCSGHPDAAEHEKMTLDDILPPFQAAMGW